MNSFIRKGLILAICLSVSVFAITAGQILYMEAKAVVAQWLLERAWQQQLEKHKTGIKPWPWADMYPTAKLDIPSLGQSFLIANTDSGQALAFAPGLNGVSDSNHYIISGHNDTHFKQLGSLKDDDEIVLTVFDVNQVETKHFHVVHREIFDTEESQLVLNESNEQAQLLLITCYPFRSGQQTSKRFVIMAVEEAMAIEKEHSVIESG